MALELHLDGAAERARVDEAEAVPAALQHLERGQRGPRRVPGGRVREPALAVDEKHVRRLPRQPGGQPREHELGGDVHPVLQEHGVLGQVLVVAVEVGVVVARLPDHQHARHPVHLVQPRVRVPEVGAGGLGDELVAEGGAEEHRTLGHPGDPVEPGGLVLRQPVPVDGLGVAGQPHPQVHLDHVADAHVDGGARELPVDGVHGPLHAVHGHALLGVAVGLHARRALLAGPRQSWVDLLGELVVAQAGLGVNGAVPVARPEVSLPLLAADDVVAQKEALEHHDDEDGRPGPPGRARRRERHDARGRGGRKHTAQFLSVIRAVV